MLITETFKDNRLSTSFEVFPPKNNAPYKPVEDAVDKLAVYHPDFISVTYGAGGGTSVNTPKIAAHIQNDLSIPALAHLTCASSTKKELDKIINDLGAAGVNNILALRGDLPDGYDPDNPDYYHYAYELIEAIKSKGDFCIGAACYPECHLEAESLQKDIENLKIARITDDELNTLSETDRKAAYLYYLMNQGYSYSEKIIKSSNVTDSEYAYFSENNYKLKGFDTKVNWERNYLYQDTLKKILGSVGSIPKEEKESLL